MLSLQMLLMIFMRYEGELRSVKSDMALALF